MRNHKTIKAADLFCGAGGTSTGLMKACQELGYKLELTAINHWNVAIDTHSVNHPGAQHLCESLDNVDPRKLVPGGRLDLLVASPECIHHSNARGGRPMNDQSRSGAWMIMRWVESLYIDTIIVENIPEFLTWGPLGVNKRPLKSKRGQTFIAFITALRSYGYNVEYRFLTAANYGDPTTRERLFVIARRGRKRIQWPDPTHTQDGRSDMFYSTKPWVPAREIIDWSIKGTSIFNRKKPLARPTIKRIVTGLEKFGGPDAEPFIVVLRNHCSAQSVDEPLPTITAGGNHVGLVEPFIVRYNGGKTEEGCRRVHSIDEPIPTIASGGNQYGLVQPFLIKYYKQGEGVQSVDEPLATVTTKDHFGLVEGDALDIRFRMLQPHELAAAMGFPKSYQFKGSKKDIVKQIGNAVPVHLAAALAKANLAA